MKKKKGLYMAGRRVEVAVDFAVEGYDGGPCRKGGGYARGAEAAGVGDEDFVEPELVWIGVVDLDVPRVEGEGFGGIGGDEFCGGCDLAIDGVNHAHDT